MKFSKKLAALMEERQRLLADYAKTISLPTGQPQSNAKARLDGLDHEIIKEIQRIWEGKAS